MMAPMGRRRPQLALFLIAIVAGLLARAERSDRIDQLAQTLLIDPSFKVRVQAALVLGKLGDARGAPALIEALRDENDTVRGAAAGALGKLGDQRAVDALTALRNDGSSFVRTAVDKALAQLERARGIRGQGSPSPGSRPRFYLNVNIAGSASGLAARTLHEAVTAEMARLPGVTLDAPAGGKLTSWSVEGHITNLKVADGRLDCDVSVAIATWPTRSIKAMASAGASVPGVSRADDTGAQRDCLNGAAQQIAQEVGRFLQAQ